jgi:hypothetical protein
LTVFGDQYVDNFVAVNVSLGSNIVIRAIAEFDYETGTLIVGIENVGTDVDPEYAFFHIKKN